MVLVPPPSTLSVISDEVLDATVPMARDPSRITTVACGRSAAGVVEADGESDLTQEVRNNTGTTTSSVRIPKDYPTGSRRSTSGLAFVLHTERFHRIDSGGAAGGQVAG